MNRIPFGQETRLEAISATCLDCGVKRGNFHEYGCPLESCPKCGGRLLECSCMALSLPDEFKTVQAVARTMSVDQVLALAQRSDHLGRNYTEKAAFTWMLSNAPLDLQEEAMRMALDLLGARQDGDLISVPLDKAAEALGLTTEEAAPIMEELEVEALYPGWDKAGGREQ